MIRCPDALRKHSYSPTHLFDEITGSHTWRPFVSVSFRDLRKGLTLLSGYRRKRSDRLDHPLAPTNRTHRSTLFEFGDMHGLGEFFVAVLTEKNILTHSDSPGPIVAPIPPVRNSQSFSTLISVAARACICILEQLAADIATIDARCVEFFRRLGRTRHQFDPPLSYQIENPISGPIGFTGNSLEVTDGLIGAYSGTPAGGFADLRNRYAASNTGTAFDEFSCTADLRQPIESLGWYNIRNLGVFLWWLTAFPIAAATPVAGVGAVAGNAPCFTFDPSGRDMPLFAPSQRAATSATADQFWGENWISPSEWVLPVAIRQTLWNQLLLSGTPQYLYGNAFWVGLMAGGVSAPVPVSTVTIHPERGRFSFPGGAPVGTITVNYSFGLL